MYTVSVTVEGTGRGLLMHKMSAEAEAGLEAKVKKSTPTSRPREEEAEMVAYRLNPEEGQTKGPLFLPAEHFLGCMLAIGSSFQIRGKGKKTYKDAFKGCLEVVPDALILRTTAGEAFRSYGIDTRTVKNPSTGKRNLRHRPHFKAGWQTSFTIQVGDDTIPFDVIQAALEKAGREKCVGDYRPRFGQFRIVHCELTKEQAA